MINCIICGNPITDLEHKITFGMDGDFIHTKCSKHKEKFLDTLDRMLEVTLTQYLNGSYNPFC